MTKDFDIFEKAKKIHKKNLLTRDRFLGYKSMPDFDWRTVPREVPDQKIEEFFKSQHHLVNLLTLTRELGFDITQNIPLVCYSKRTQQYYTVQPDSDKYLLKNRLVFHYRGRYTNKSGIMIKDPKDPNNWIWNPEYEALGLTKKNAFFLETGQRAKTSKLFRLRKDLFDRSNKVHNSLALPEYSQRSNIICLDIDTHWWQMKTELDILNYEDFSDALIKYLVKDLALNVVLLEKSKVFRGFHVYIKLQNIHNKKHIEGILKQIIKEKCACDTDIRSTTKAIRLPFSWDYDVINLETNKKINHIVKFINYTLNKLSQPVLEDNNTLMTRLRKQLNNTIYEEHNKVKKKFFVWDRRVDKDGVPREGFYWDTHIRAGNRVGGEGLQWILCNLCIKFNKSVYEFIELSMQYKGSSKDLNTWDGNKIYSECSKMYEYAKRLYRTQDTERKKVEVKRFYSNKSLLTKKEIRIIKKIIMESVFSKYKERNSKMKAEALVVFQEILGSIRFQEMYRRRVKGYVKKEKALEMEIGFQFSDKFFYKIKRSNNLHFNPKTLFNVFKNKLLNVYIHKNGSTYIPILSSCIQYTYSNQYEFLFNRNILYIYYYINNKNNGMIEKYTNMLNRFKKEKIENRRNEQELKRRRVCGDGLGII